MLRCLLLVAIFAFSALSVSVQQETQCSSNGSKKISPKRSCYIVKKLLQMKCKTTIVQTTDPWTGRLRTKTIRRCGPVHIESCKLLSETILDSRVGTIKFPSLSQYHNISYEKIYCTWTAQAKPSQHYYIEVRNLTASDTHIINGTKLCVYIDGEKTRACQRGMRLANLTVPVAVTTTSRNLNITLELLRGNAQNLSITLMGSYKRLKRTTSVPHLSTTSQPPDATDICYVKGKTSKQRMPTLGRYYYDHVLTKCIKYRRGHKDRADRYTGYGFESLTSCRQQCVFNNLQGLSSVIHSSSGSTLTSAEVP